MNSQAHKLQSYDGLLRFVFDFSHDMPIYSDYQLLLREGLFIERNLLCPNNYINN